MRSGHDCPLISFNSTAFYFYRYIPKSKLNLVKEVSGLRQQCSNAISQMKPYDQGHFVYKRDQSPSRPAPNNFASPYNAIMKFALTSLFSALLVGCTAAQRIAIGYPADRTTAAAGSKITVEIDRPVRPCLSRHFRRFDRPSNYRIRCQLPRKLQ